MKKILLWVFIAVVVLLTALGVYYVSSPAKAQDLTYETVKKSIKTEEAFFVREEKVYYSENSGTLYNNTSSGERVSANALLATVYHSDVSSDKLASLKTINKKIEDETEKNSRISSYGVDYSDQESTVAAIVDAIPALAQKDRISEIANYKTIINNLRSGTDTEDVDKLDMLYAEKADIELSMNSSKTELNTDMAGVFTTYIDGLESFLTAENIKEYTPSYFETLPEPENKRLSDSVVEAGAPVCKVQNNHVWYLSMILPTESLPECSEGTAVSLKLDTIGNEEIDGKIYFISEDENGKTLLTVKCSEYVEGAFSYRITGAELIFKSYAGYKVPIYAIRTGENREKYVLCRSGAKEYKCYCTVDYTNPEEEYIIINSAPDAEYRLENMELVVIGEK